MNSEIGLTLDERIRQSLPPLSGPLRIDAFLAVMTRERARLAAARSQAARQTGASVKAQRTPPLGPAADPSPAARPSEPGAEEVVDSRKLRAEVDAFLHRDERHDATDNEVADYLEFMGPTGFNPEELPE